MVTPLPRETAEDRVRVAIRAALDDSYRLYPNVGWVLKETRDKPARDGETDLVIVHPERGLLVVETKGGRIRRDGTGRWFSGEHALPVPPFQQAETSKHALARKLVELPDWPGGRADIRVGHAVAFPDAEVGALAAPGRGLGPEAPRELILDGALIRSRDAVHAWLEGVYAYWLGDGRRGRPFDRRQMSLIDETFAPPALELRPALLRHVEEGEEEVVRATQTQYRVLNTLRGQRRAAVTGPAGCGKTILAAEKARRLAKEGFRTLLVCFNQPLARSLAEILAGAQAPAGLEVSTFHELCLRLAREHGLLPSPEPTEKGREWFDQVLPSALEKAIALGGGRYNAIIVDEGQDFERSWLESLDLLLMEPGEGVLYVFHDPGQALYREDVVDTLGLPEYPIEENCRNPGPVHALAARHAQGLENVAVLRADGPDPEVIVAAPGHETTEALRKVLHRLVVEQRLAPGRIAVLVGGSLAGSGVWKKGQYGDQVLWNGQYDDAGHSLGLAAGEVPPQPPDTVLCDTIRRFKGLEREVVILAELDPAAERPHQLLYVGTTRARQHLVVITPAPLEPLEPLEPPGGLRQSRA
jgi:hypothetical protein